MVKETVIFALTSSTDLAAAIAKDLGLPLGKIKVEHFADGEILVEPQESVHGNAAGDCARTLSIHHSEYLPAGDRTPDGSSCLH